MHVIWIHVKKKKKHLFPKIIFQAKTYCRYTVLGWDRQMLFFFSGAERYTYL